MPFSHEQHEHKGANFGLPAQQPPFGFYGSFAPTPSILQTPYYYPLYGQVPFQIPANLANLAQDSNDNSPTPLKKILKRKYQFSSDVKPEEKKVADVIEIKDDDNTDVEDFDLPHNFLLHCLDLHIENDPIVRYTITDHFFVPPKGLEAYVEIDEDEARAAEARAAFDERNASIELTKLTPRTKPLDKEEKALCKADYRLPPVFFSSTNKFPHDMRTLATPPSILYYQTNDKYFTQEEIADYLKNPDHNYDWIVNELINELHALYIRVRNIDNQASILKYFVKIMLPSIADYNHIIDKLVMRIRRLFIDWRNKLWAGILIKYKELDKKYKNPSKKLSAVQIANKMSEKDIRKIWNQWTCTIDKTALEVAMESLRDVCAMGFRAIEVAENVNKAHDDFLCLYNDLYTVNLAITTRYNIANSMDLSIYYFEEFKRKSSKK
ncbi:unnamed protein product [Rhizophagus irregularis]|nr:unnamed protein product [Rhizophagus irregularis]